MSSDYFLNILKQFGLVNGELFLGDLRSEIEYLYYIDANLCSKD
jgi:hypothetical protein